MRIEATNQTMQPSGEVERFAVDDQSSPPVDRRRSPTKIATPSHCCQMVDTGTWNRLDDAARQEFRALFRQFQDSLRDAGVHDGYDLGMDWSVQLTDGVWTISNGSKILDEVTSSRREVIDALYTDGVQNLNR